MKNKIKIGEETYKKIKELWEIIQEKNIKIKKLEEENKFLEKRNEELIIDCRDFCLERNDLFEENQQLKQQLHELSNKIVK